MFKSAVLASDEIILPPIIRSTQKVSFYTKFSLNFTHVCISVLRTSTSQAMAVCTITNVISTMAFSISYTGVRQAGSFF
jgi:hypothetical protein